jgi:hypothetical protein
LVFLKIELELSNNNYKLLEKVILNMNIVLLKLHNKCKQELQPTKQK